MFKLCIYWHWLHQVIIFIKKLLMFWWFMKPFFSLATVSSDWPLRLNSLKLKGSIYYFNKYTSITWQKDKYLMADKKITNTQKTEDWDAQTTKNPNWHELRCSIWVCSSNFTNTTSWVKELGAIALPTFKNWGRDSFAPFLALNLRKKTFLL